MGKIVVDLCLKQYKEREETLIDNEKHAAEGYKDSDDEENSEDVMSDNENEDEDAEKDFKDTKAKLAKFVNGELDDEDDDDENDSDYEFNCGDMQLYDSALDEIDELLYLKQTVEGMHSQQP